MEGRGRPRWRRGLVWRGQRRGRTAGQRRAGGARLVTSSAIAGHVQHPHHGPLLAALVGRTPRHLSWQHHRRPAGELTEYPHMKCCRVSLTLPEVLQAGRDLQLVELTPLLLQQAQAVVVLLALHSGAGVVPEVGVVQVRTVRACQPLPANTSQTREKITQPTCVLSLLCHCWSETRGAGRTPCTSARPCPCPWKHIGITKIVSN